MERTTHPEALEALVEGRTGCRGAKWRAHDEDNFGLDPCAPRLHQKPPESTGRGHSASLISLPWSGDEERFGHKDRPRQSGGGILTRAKAPISSFGEQVRRGIAIPARWTGEIDPGDCGAMAAQMLAVHDGKIAFEAWGTRNSNTIARG